MAGRRPVTDRPTAPTAWTAVEPVILRSCGFSSARLRPLSDRRLHGMAEDALVAAEALDELRGPVLGAIGDRRRHGDAVERADMRRAERFVRRWRRVPRPRGRPVLAALFESWNARVDDRERRSEALADGYRTACGEADRHVRALIVDDPFLEAVFTNNPTIAGLLADPKAAGRRDLTRTVVSYLQSFCTKAETAGIYGPSNVVELQPGTRPLAAPGAVPGDRAERIATMSHWAAAEIADQLADGDGTVARLYRRADLPPPQDSEVERRLLDLADGTLTVEEAIECVPGLDRAAGHEVVADLQRRTAVEVGLRIPPDVFDPLEALPAVTTGGRAVSPDHFRKLIVAVRDASSHDERAPALRRLEEEFRATTGRDPRRVGSYYTDRFVYTAEACRNVPATAGRGYIADVRARLSPVLDLLASAAITRRERQHALLAPELTAHGGRMPATAVRAREGAGTDPAQQCPCQAKNHPGLRAVLAADATRPEVAVASTDPRLATELRDDLDRWPLFCAPDVMIGEERLILSETHHILPVTSLPFVGIDPPDARQRGDFDDVLRVWAGGRRVLLPDVRRTGKAMDFTAVGMDLLCLDTVRVRPGSVSWPIADLEVRTGVAGRPVLAARGGDTEFLLRSTMSATTTATSS